jgi:GNAT superfamily N-acetyltransferase
VLSDYLFSFVLCRELDVLERAHPAAARSGRAPRPDDFADCPTAWPDFPCFFYLSDPAGKLIASTGALPDAMVTTADGIRRPWAWTRDLYCAPEFRGKGLATQLQSATTRTLHEKGIARGSVFGMPATRHIYQKIGATLAGFATRYIQLTSASPFLRAHLGDSTAVKALGAIARPVVASIARARWADARAVAPRSARLIRICPATIDPCVAARAFDRVWHSTPFHFDETLATIRWKLRRANLRRDGRCELHFLSTGYGALVGFFISRLMRVTEPLHGNYRDFVLMNLMHFGLFEEDPSLYAPLLDHVIELFWSSPAEVLEILSSCKPLLGASRARGLLRVGRGMSFTVAIPQGWNLAPEDYRVTNWPLTLFRGDGFLC